LKNPTVKSTIDIDNHKLHEIREIVVTWQGSTVADLVDNDLNSNNLGFFPDLTKLKAIGCMHIIALEEVIKRTRKAFSDGVSSHGRSLYKILQEFIVIELNCQLGLGKMFVVLFKNLLLYFHYAFV
jgi:hypothetical protein